MGTMVVVVVKATVNRAEKGGYRKVESERQDPAWTKRQEARASLNWQRKRKGKEKRGFSSSLRKCYLAQPALK
jgi:hypothetical protein